MGDKKELRIPVRQMVEFLFRSGDIAGGFSGTQRAQEGTRIHQKLQKKAPDGYEKEVFLRSRMELTPEVDMVVEGRADGSCQEEGVWTVDEIKSTYLSLERLAVNPTHLAQAKCYAYMYAQQHSLERMRVRLVYCHVETEQVRNFDDDFSFSELEVFFQDALKQYGIWLIWRERWERGRNDSAAQISFPFSDFRPGQRTMAAYIFKAIAEGERLFLQAPTGIGKTMSALFPAIKAFERGKVERIFYLTAKNVTGQAARNALEILRAEGLKVKSISLTAKDKLCPMEERLCHPDICPRAKGHFDRINEALYAALEAEDCFSKESILRWSEAYQVCPFEFSLDLSLWADVIICDYNYAFDPTASLKRFFQEEKRDYVLLVDEAHNLVDRARDMFSAHISKRSFMEFHKKLKADSGQDQFQSLKRSLTRINQDFLALQKRFDGADYGIEEAPDEKLYYDCTLFSQACEEYLLENGAAAGQETMELYFNVLFFLRIWDVYGDGYLCYGQRVGQDLFLKLFCIHPAKQLQEVYAGVRSVVFFSATFTPIEYYKDLLGGQGRDKAIALESPFDPEKKLVMIADGIRATYDARERTRSEVVSMLYQFYMAREGHYMVFFPSFQYLNLIYEFFIDAYPQVRTVRQESAMTEEDREEFLSYFALEEGAVLGFCVLGGVFSEGIDLKGDRLIGVAVVSVGLPQLGLERNLIQGYIQERSGLGFQYAYMYPGINKIFQAAGRVIRTEEDQGVILLMDERFGQSRYRDLFPKDWFPCYRVTPRSIGPIVKEFWKGQGC